MLEVGSDHGQISASSGKQCLLAYPATTSTTNLKLSEFAKITKKLKA